MLHIFRGGGRGGEGVGMEIMVRQVREERLVGVVVGAGVEAMGAGQEDCGYRPFQF